MTTKELSQVAGVSERTIRRIAENEVGIVYEKGKKAIYTEKEAIEIMRLARKKGFIQPRQNADVVTRSDLAAFGTAIVSEMMKQFLPIIQGQQKQIEFIQDYYSIKGYASKLGQQITFSEALNLGRIAGKVSREKNIEIRKIDDERFGLVNSYSIKVLDEVFQI